MQDNHIFEPFTLTPKTVLKNRLVMAPMTTWSGNADGTISQSELDYYHVRSQGVAMTITATTYTQATGKGFSGQFYAGDDTMLASLTQLATSIKSAGAVAILQVFHAGRKANPADMPEGVTLSASAVAAKREDNNTPRAMTNDEIESMLKSFADIIKRAHQAGFNGVELHGANTYLLQQFFSPHSNQRSDHWGGNIDKRMHLPLAAINACINAKKALNDDNFILGCRFSPEENSNPGITLEDTDKLVDALCQTELDYLHISLNDYRQTSIRSASDQTMILNRILKTVNRRKPLIAVGSVHTTDDAKGALATGADLVALGRQLLIDADTVQKWQCGKIANTHYKRDFQKQNHMPKPLHDIIISREGWIPLID